MNSLRPALFTTLRWPVVWVLALGGAVALGTALALWRNEGARIQSQFQQAAEDRYAVAANVLEADLRLMEAVQAFFSGSHVVERAEFHRFAQSLLPHCRTIQALEWIPRVPGTQRAAYEAAARRDGFTQFQIVERNAQGETVPAGPRTEHYPVFFLEPYAGNEAALGFDLASDPVRRQALEQVRQTGQILASGRVKLIQTKDDQWGCLIFAPVYREAPGNTRPAEPPLGFVLGVFRMQNLMQPVLARLQPIGVDIHITDESAPPEERLLYWHPANGRPGTARPRALFEGAEPPRLDFRRALPVAGRLWQFRCTAAPDRLLFQRTMRPWTTLVTIVAFTVLLAAYLQNQLRRSEQIARLVEARTAALTRANADLAEENRARTQAEARLAASLGAKEVLLREVHHRVRNNLQVICSLLQLQSGHLKEAVALKLATEMRHRVRSMALVYEKLQASADLARIDFSEYLHNLAAELLRAWGSERPGIRTEFTLAPVRLNLDTAIPCGLIANELVANAFKHAFPEQARATAAPCFQPTVSLHLQTELDGRIVLSVRDNGVGLPRHLDLQATTTLGLQVVKLLVEQLNGRITLDRRDGTQYTIEFQEVRYRERQ